MKTCIGARAQNGNQETEHRSYDGATKRLSIYVITGGGVGCTMSNDMTIANRKTEKLTRTKTRITSSERGNHTRRPDSNKRGGRVLMREVGM